jgi:3-methyladenine DNA glycosylase AlkD/short-subunit dehydrogenase
VPTARDVKRALDALAVPEKARVLARFFKTEPGEYGEGDRFLGVTVPTQRALVKRLGSLPIDEAIALLGSPVHEHRFTAVVFFVDRYQQGDGAERQAVFEAYLAHATRIDNWDLVDASAHLVVGPHIEKRPRAVLGRLASSENLWERRIAMVATFHFIRRGEATLALWVAEKRLGDEHDLIHKAVGWMLREVGKRASRDALLGLLDVHAPFTARTTLRYALERFSAEERRRYRRVRRPQPRCFLSIGDRSIRIADRARRRYGAPMSKKTIIVVGFGPGISTAVAERFGSEGFRVALVARNAERLAAGVKALEAKGIEARAFTADVSHPEAARKVVAEVRAAMGPVHALEWTAYGGGAGDLLTASASDVRGALDIATTSLLAAIQEALPDLRASRGAILVTNGGLGYFDAQVDATAVSWNAMGLAMANAAKHKMVGLLAEKLRGEGVYVGEVMVLGIVKGTAFDQGQGVIEASSVATKFWELYLARADVSARVG